MPGTTRFLLAKRSARQWTDAIQVKVGFSLLLLVVLAIPTFLLLLQNSALLLYYSFYPVLTGLGLYLRYRGFEYSSSVVIVLSVYAVVTGLAWLAGFERASLLSWWIIALLPWVMFSHEQRAGLTIMTIIPVVFSFAVPYLPHFESPLLPAEREFVLQILRISVALGAFSCVFFLREKLHESEKLRVLENEFYHDSLHAIPLPIIIKDGITLDFIFFNQAAQLTYDLKPGMPNSNATTFSPSCAAAVSRLDQEVLRSVTYHIEADENLVHQTGLHWHFRTYRIPLELKSSGRRLLINVSEDLRAIDHVLRKAQKSGEILDHVYQLISPVLFRLDIPTEKISFVHPETLSAPAPQLSAELENYLQYYLSRNHNLAATTPGYHNFTLGNRSFDLFFGYLNAGSALTGVLTETRKASDSDLT